MKRGKHFGCKIHRRVFFSEQAMKEHVKEKCHPDNIVRLKGDDLLGRWTYNMISESIDNSNLSEKEKEEQRQANIW